MQIEITKRQVTLATLMAATLGLVGCGGSSSGGDDDQVDLEDVEDIEEIEDIDDIEDIGGDGGGDGPDTEQTLAVDREDVVIRLARSSARDVMRQAKAGQPIFVKGFSENFESPFGNRFPRNEECGDAFNPIEDTESSFVADFSDCQITFLNGNQMRIDGGFMVSHGEGGANTQGGFHDFSYEIEAEDLEFRFLSDVENELALGGFTADFWDGDMHLDYTDTEALTASPDWKLNLDRFEMDLEHDCPERLGGERVGFKLGLADLSATTAPSSMGQPRSDVTQEGQLIITDMAESFDGTYNFETIEPVVLANEPGATNDPQSGIMRITGPDGFDITVEYEQSGYFVEGGVVESRFAPTLAEAAEDPTGVDSEAIPKFLAETVCELQTES